MASRKTTRDVVLTVPAVWKTPTFFAGAAPDEVGTVLDAAALVVPWATKLVCSHQDASEEARRQGVEEAVAAAVAHLADDRLDRTRLELEDARVQASRLRTELSQELARTSDATQQLAVAAARASDAEERGRAAALLTADERLRHELAVAAERQAALEAELRQRATDVTSDRDALRARVAELQDERQRLADENAQLRTPSGRGETGEADVRAVVEALGYRCVDTARAKNKELYGDLLVCCGAADDDAEGSDSDASTGGAPARGTRVAVEVKNRATVRAADVAHFEEKVRRGVAEGRFEGGLFVSLRCPLPGRTSSAQQRLIEDGRGRASVPMAYLSAERGNPARPVTADQIGVVVQAHVALSEQAGLLRGGDAAMDEFELKRLRAHFVDLVAHTTAMFAEFTQQQGLLDGARRSLDAMRQRCIGMYRGARRLHASVPWLRARPLEQLGFERGLDHAVKLASECRFVWNNVTNKDSLAAAMGSRECVHATAMAELAQVAKEAKEAEGDNVSAPKRARTEE